MIYQALTYIKYFTLLFIKRLKIEYLFWGQFKLQKGSNFTCNIQVFFSKENYKDIYNYEHRKQYIAELLEKIFER